MNPDEIPNILNHVSIGTNRFTEAIEFYDAVMATIGAKRQHEIEDIAVAYGKLFPEFWVQRPIDGESANVGNGIHIAFLARDKDAVHAFHRAAVDAGGVSDGEPGPRPEYGPYYYGCFVKDLDGNKIEANVIPLPD